MASEWLDAYARRLREASASIRAGSATPDAAAAALAKAWASDRAESHRLRLGPLEAAIPTGGVEGGPAHREGYAAYLGRVADGAADAAAGAASGVAPASAPAAPTPHPRATP
jgi:hypothetical protein